MSKDKQSQQENQSRSRVNKPVQKEPHGMETAVTNPTPPLQRTYTNPHTLSPADAQTLQRTIGNQALRRLTIQRKMTVGPVGDKYEQEADAVAKQVVSKLNTTSPQNAPSQTAQRQEEEDLQMKPLVQRQEDEEELQMKPVQRQEEGKLQAKSEDPILAGGELSGDVESSVQSAKSGGQSLDDTMRGSMENAFNADFSSVKIHNDTQSDSLNRSLSARAFTSGQDIFFRNGEYNPSSSSGQELLAHELTHTIQQNGAKQPIQRKSDKLPSKKTLQDRAKAGTKIGGTSLYGKILNAVDDYHTKTANDDYSAQLQQLVAIHKLLIKWQVSHGIADTGAETSKNKKETARRGVLQDIKDDFLPKETADVYHQAKVANDDQDVYMLMTLMDVMATQPGIRGEIESDYATALRSFSASTQESNTAEGIMTGDKATLIPSMTGSSVDALSNKHQNLQNLDTDPSGGMIPTGTLDSPINGTDSNTLKAIKQERQKLMALAPATAQMSKAEYMAVALYTDEAGYGPMNSLLRGQTSEVSGDNKKSRQANLDAREETKQAMLMATSMLNRLPNWNGSTVYRGEDASWTSPGNLNGGDFVVMPSFTSTSMNQGTAKNFASGKGTNGTVWEIRGITHSGKDISKLTVQQQKDVIMNMNGIGANTEDEVLLKPYTRLRIHSITAGTNYSYHIVADQA